MNSEIEQLKQDLVSLRQDFLLRSEVLENRILALENPFDSEPEAAPPTREEVLTTSGYTPTEPFPTPAESAKIESDKFRNKLAKYLLMEKLQDWLGPLQGILATIGPIYEDDKEKGKLPVFFLTVAGLFTLTIGFGYLLQYSFNNWFGPLVKMALCFSGSFAILFIGTRLYHRKLHRDYASSLIGISFVLNYLCVYFVTVYYQLTSSNIGFALLFANTLAAYVFASKYVTRIVAVVTTIGGAFAPFILEVELTHPAFNLCYLILLAASSLRLARQINWPLLAHGSFVLLGGIVEYLVFVGNLPGNLISIFLLHLFFYLYCYHCLYQNKHMLDKLDETRTLILTANISLMLVNLSGFTDIIRIETGVLYLLNAMIFVGMLFWKWRHFSDSQRTLLISDAASFFGFCVPAIFSPDLNALFWAQEGLLLVFLGFLYPGCIVRREGYGLLALSLAQVGFMSKELVPVWPGIFCFLCLF